MLMHKTSEIEKDADRAFSGRLPEFLLIGAMKSGSSSLWAYLNQHPEIFMCSPKEPRFFSIDEIYERGIDWYRNCFADARHEQMCGEASVCYTRYPLYSEAAVRISQHLPMAKFIYVIRDPVQRALSHYRHNMQERLIGGNGPIPFDEAVKEDASILTAGHYFDQIARYREHYSSGSFLCIQFEELVDKPARVFESVASFLGISKDSFLDMKMIHANAFGYRIGRRRAFSIRSRLRYLRLNHLVRLLPERIRLRLMAMMTHKLTARIIAHRAARQLNCEIQPEMESAKSFLRNYYMGRNEKLASLVKVGPLLWEQVD